MASRSIGSPSRISGYSAVSYPASLAYSIGQPIMRKTYDFVPATKKLVNASIISFLATVMFMISFTSPYWLVSYEYTYNPFKSMGLWEFCFDGYRYPKYQFDYKFTGCNYIFASEYRIIWEWLLPVWLMATQTFMTIALMCLVTCMTIVALLLVRWPMQTIMRHEWHLIGICAILHAIIVGCLFLSVLVFGVKCWARDWLQNPNFNYLSWSYYFAVISGVFFTVSGLMMLHEAYEARDRKRKVNNLVQMEPQQSHIPMGSTQEIPSDTQPPQYQLYGPGQNPYSGVAGLNPAFSREQSLHSGYSQQHSAYM